MAGNADEPPHPIKLQNENRRKKKVVNSPTTIKNAFDQWLSYLARQTQLEEGKPPCKDGCFDALVDAEIRQAVANFLVWHGEKDKADRDQTLVDWIHASRANGWNGTNHKYRFPLPYCGEVSADALETLRNHQPMCKQACCKLFNKGRDAWSAIRKQADRSTVVSPHGNTGKPNGRNRKDSDPVMVQLRGFFSEMEKLGEPCATRIVREEVGETTLRDHDDKAIYLPMYYNKIWDHVNDKAAINANHIFHVDSSSVSIDAHGKKHVVMKIRTADVADAATIQVELKKSGAKNLVLPTSTWPQVLKKPGRNPKKIIEFFTKWISFVPRPYQPEMCPKPTAVQTEDANKNKSKEKTPASKRVKKRKMDALEAAAMARQEKSDDSVDESINLAQLKQQMEEAEAAADLSGESSDEEDIVLADLVR